MTPGRVLQSLLLPSVLGALLLTPLPGTGSTELPPPETLRTWIEEMKTAERGPFEGIRWFCRDGTVLPPKPYACADHGGGIQHGAWNARARALREGGYLIANVLAQVEPADFTGPEADLEALTQILVERFLISWDDGWVMRATQTYRGALQAEDEEAGALALVRAMLADPLWRDPNRFMLMRETVRLLPLQADEASAGYVRALAKTLADEDPGFQKLRIKIHNQLEPRDADAVRAYAAERGGGEARRRYDELATSIDELFETGELTERLRDLADRKAGTPLATKLREAAGRLGPESRPELRFATAAPLLGELRDAFVEPAFADPDDGLALLLTSLDLERALFRDGNLVLESIAVRSRLERLWLLDYVANALYGTGFLTPSQAEAIDQSVIRLERARTPTLAEHIEELQYLARAPEWSSRWLDFDFGRTIGRWSEIEPEAVLYPQDRLRSSALLLYGRVLDGLILDANRMAGIEYEIFGERVGSGLRALNPGLARGPLRRLGANPDMMQQNGIYLLPETVSDLPRIDGILTRGEGSSLSHVQLLARNLGIPNAVVTKALLPRIESRIGEPIVMAVSPKGVVRIARDGPEWDEVFGVEQEMPEVRIEPDLEQLDLATRRILPISSLRATDSGRVSGPKGANLGELRFLFGEAVPDGFVIPFGRFRALLDQPIAPGEPSVWDWMRARYAEILRAEGEPDRQDRMVRSFLKRLRTRILEIDPDEDFRDDLRAALDRLGPDGSFGVFVRSDTNVEDLPGFTGAGLNLTRANVVGFDAILQAIHEVWASPFTERAYSWRNANMTKPEYVFPAVTVQLAFPAEKSGVVVTADVESGSREWLTVAASEGVGGAVDGQATESLRVRLRDGEVRALARATAPERSVLSSQGGIVRKRARAPERLLQPGELRQLIALATDVEQRFLSLEGAPADIEFAFADGRLALLQIRPFVESGRAQQSRFLNALDGGFAARNEKRVALQEVPEAMQPTAPAVTGGSP